MNDMLDKWSMFIRDSVRGWLTSFAWIRDKSKKLIKLELNKLQEDFVEVYEYCREHKIPCRVIVLKPRQKGISTISVGVTYHRLSESPGTGMIIGGEYSQTDNLWRICQTYAKEDKFDWSVKEKTTINSREGTWGNGSFLQKGTAGDKDEGRSGTFQVVIMTEVAYWQQEGVANAGEVMNGLKNCVPDLPDTLIVEESTSSGPAGEFFEHWKLAVSFEDFKRGKRGNGMVRIFRGWHEFADSVPFGGATDYEKSEVINTMTEEEREMMDDYALTVDQLVWRRKTILEKCENDTAKFDREFPLTPAHAFRASGNRVFNRAGIKWQEKVATVQRPTWGNLEGEFPNVSFVPSSPDDAKFKVFERPQVGLRYAIPADTMTGESQTTSDEPDRNSVLVIRDGYIDASTGKWNPPAIAARIMPPCFWDPDILEEAVAKLSAYYGLCMVAPEMNMDRGMVELLKKREIVPIYQRTVFNEREDREEKKLGWVTTESTRRMILANLARAIREFGKVGEGVEIRCEHAINECSLFIRKQSGREEAMYGAKDDDVLALAIGLTVVASGTKMVRQSTTREVPPEIQRLRRAGGRRKDPTYG